MLPPPAITTRRTGLSSLAHLAHHAAQVVARGEEEDLVAFLDDRVALGPNAAAAAVDGDDARVRLRQVLAQLAQRVADERAALLRAHADEVHLAVREIQHLQRARDGGSAARCTR